MSHTNSSKDQTTAFVSTAIPYVNAAPHLGHALEFVLADAVVATKRQHGADVWFTSGTDDNSSKNANAATVNGVDTQVWVDANAERFVRLLRELSIQPDAFVRTSANSDHQRSVHRLWQLCLARGDIYPATYEGSYCVGCERFIRPSELASDGRCPEHAAPLESVTERNLFFRLSNYTTTLTQLIESNRLRIVPEAARSETLALLKAGLDDISISRQAKPDACAWGLPAPVYPDPTLPQQTIWVWFDALTNYLTSLGFGGADSNYQRYWVNATERVHVVGKGISRFHTIIWPALLLSAGLPLPTEVLVHGYLTLDSVKISKSGGNAVEPFGLIEKFGGDAVRYFLLRHVHPTKDGDFSEARLEAAYRAELADQYGNLVSRLTALVIKCCAGRVPSVEAIDDLVTDALEDATRRARDAQLRFAHHEALATVFHLLAQLNRYFDANAPWALAKAAQAGDAEARGRLNAVLASTGCALVRASQLLAPYLPYATKRAVAALGAQPLCATPAHNEHNFSAEVTTLRLFPK